MARQRKRNRQGKSGYKPRSSRDFRHMTIEQLTELEAAREAFFISVRYPDGVIRCPHCHGDNVKRLQRSRKYKCKTRGCRKQFTLTSGTALDGCHMPYRRMYEVFYHMSVPVLGMSAKDLATKIFASIPGTWKFMNRVRRVMLADNMTVQLNGSLEVDETLTGGKAEGNGRGYTGNKLRVIGAKERPKHGSKVLFRVVTDRSRDTIVEFLKEVMGPNVYAVYTDDFKGYQGIDQVFGIRHEAVNHSKKQWRKGRACTNGIESPWSTWNNIIKAVYHYVGEKYMDLYLAEAAWRMNHREDPDPLVSLARLMFSTNSQSMKARPHLGQPPKEKQGRKARAQTKSAYYEAEADESDYYHSQAAHYQEGSKGKANKYHRKADCKRGSRIREENRRSGRGEGNEPCGICCKDKSSSPSLKKLAEQVTSWSGYYHTKRIDEPNFKGQRVHHKQADCITGKNISETNWRPGKGDGTEPCYLCCGDDLEERSLMA